MPAATSAASRSGVPLAGPIVATIFVRRGAGAAIARRVAAWVTSRLASARKASQPGYSARPPSSSSIRSSWLYFATRSVRAGAPVLIWPAPVATARSAIVVSSVSPERCEMTAA